MSVWTMACRRTLSSVKTAVVALVPTPEERTAEQLAKAQAQAQAQAQGTKDKGEVPVAQEKVKVGVTARGSEEKVKDEL